MPTLLINAPLNPAMAGGVETNLLSMLRTLTAEPLPIEIAVLTYRKFVKAFEAEAPGLEVVPWMYHPLPISKGRVVRDFLGRHAHLLDRLVHEVKVRQKKAPPYRPRENKTALAGLNAAAIHFPTPHWFKTDLPFLYEPWDLIHLHYPQFFSRAQVAERERIYRSGCERAGLVVTATRWVKEDIVDKYGIPPEKVAVIPRSSLAGRRTLAESEVDRELAEAGISAEFIFFPAMVFEHKNHIRLFQALARLRDHEGLKLLLVLSGRRDVAHRKEVAAAIERLGVGDQIVDLGEVSDDRLTALFRRARFMVFPSLFEGLGLPLLEAFHHGLPVVAARATCTPEVVGEAGILFDGFDVDDMAAAISRAWRNPTELAELAGRGRARLDVFSWPANRTRLIACYKHVMNLAMTADEKRAFAQAVER